jgi:ABC-type sugar transport system substrate-binding protein
MKTALSALLFAVLGSVLLAAGKDGNLVIGYIGRSAANPIYTVAREGAEQAILDK